MYRTNKLNLDEIGQATRLGTKIINCRDLGISLEGKTLFKGFTYNFQRYERVGIVGGNGAGKTTFINLLTGNMAAADSVLGIVREGYLSLADSVAAAIRQPRRVLLNIPYNDQWFIPSSDNYLCRLVEDAGGEVLGSGSGKSMSSTISLEKAYSLSKEADCWLNVGWCRTLDQLEGVNPLFPDMLENIASNASRRGFDGKEVVWNDNARVSPKGGNDIWQSGVVRPDLVLRDMVVAMHSSGECKTLYYRGL